jgi:membrane protein DedA with SNARE-associated domain
MVGGVLATIVDVAHVGLPVMALLIAGESMGVPLPGETALIAAAILAGRGHFDIAVVIALAATAAIVGDNVGYLIGRRGGRALLLRHPRLRDHGERMLAMGEPFFARHGAKAVFLGRWFAGLRIAAAWLAGINRMRWPSFLFWNASGGICWAVSVGVLAYLLGHSAERVLKTAGVVGAGGIVVGGIAGVLYLRLRRRRREQARVETSEPAARRARS